MHACPPGAEQDPGASPVCRGWGTRPTPWAADLALLGPSSDPEIALGPVPRGRVPPTTAQAREEGVTPGTETAVARVQRGDGAWTSAAGGHLALRVTSGGRDRPPAPSLTHVRRGTRTRCGEQLRSDALCPRPGSETRLRPWYRGSDLELRFSAK